MRSYYSRLFSSSVLPRSSINVSVLSDPRCPWCIVAHHRLHRAIAASGLSVDFRVSFRPFFLDAELPLTSTIDRRSYYEARFGAESMSQAEAAIGTVFQKEGISELLHSASRDDSVLTPYSIDGVVSSSLPAHRLLALAQIYDDEGDDTCCFSDSVTRGLFQAYFGPTKENIADHSILTQIGLDAKLPLSAHELSKFLASDALTASVVAAAEGASSAGLSVPHFQITSSLTSAVVEMPGAVSESEILNTFRDIAEKKSPAFVSPIVNESCGSASRDGISSGNYPVPTMTVIPVKVSSLVDEIESERFKWQAENHLPTMERSMGGVWPESNPFQGSENELETNAGLFSRLDPGSDVDFYEVDGPRLEEHHLDAPARAALSRHYGALLRDVAYSGGMGTEADQKDGNLGSFSRPIAVLDLCSSFESHFPVSLAGESNTFNFRYDTGPSSENGKPAEGDLASTVEVSVSMVGLGMNAAELQANKKFNKWGTHDLNASSNLHEVVPSPVNSSTVYAADCSFDLITIALSIDYLTRPLEVLSEVWRLLKPGGRVVVSFSDRMFRSKAVALWRDAPDNATRLWIVAAYFKYSQHTESDSGVNWKRLTLLDLTPGNKQASDSDGIPQINDPIFVVQATK